MLQDFRFGLKLLWKEKAFAITALLTLALCIGANTAIFTVLRTVVLEPPSRYMFLAVRSRANDAGIAAAVRREFARADPELPLFDVKTMEQRLATSVRERRAAMTICAAFAVLALVLSAIGIYGVLAYTVSQRTREFGIRIALGARGGTVVRMVMGQGIRLAAIGLTLGVAAAALLTRLMTRMLYEVKPTDPLVFAIVAGVLMLVAMAASLVPSMRVARIKPAAALRVE